MAVGNFEPCNKITRKWEGGDVNHPDDPGGLTSRGVTAARGAEFRKAKGLAPKTVTKWTDAEVTAFYISEFWNVMGCDRLAYGVDLSTYDAGVNSGPSRARKWLLAAIGSDDMTTIKRMCAKRLGFVQGLRTWKTFGKGWARRIAGIEASAVSMWLAGYKVKAPEKVLHAEAEKADRAVEDHKTAGKAATGGSVAVGAGDAAVQGAVNWWLVGGVGLALAAVLALVAVKIMQNRERASAYSAAAFNVAAR